MVQIVSLSISYHWEQSTAKQYISIISDTTAVTMGQSDNEDLHWSGSANASCIYILLEMHNYQ